MKGYLYANWKMHKTQREALNFLASIDRVEGKNVGIAAPATLLAPMAEHATNLGISVGAQNMSEYSHGAYTGEISATQIADCGAKFVLIGHSERRHIFGETDEMIANKVDRAIVEGLPFVLCVGEKLEERDLGETEDVLKRQLKTAFEAVLENQIAEVIISYEPVWAIGTGKAATPQMAEETHEMIRNILVEIFSKEVSAKIPIIYGGSVKVSNIEALLSEPNIDGALVGGASLEASDFNQLIQCLPEEI